MAKKYRRVFYSWQTDSPNRTNRGLIEKALERALKELKQLDSIEIAERADQGAEGVAGSPDIAQTILSRIDNCFALVADVSIINPEAVRDRKTPNPNVLLELGYAWAARGVDYVIPVVNTAFGRPEELPFDLRGRKLVVYEAQEDDEDRSATVERLSKRLRSELAAIVEIAEVDHLAPRRSELISSVAADLVQILLFCDYWQMVFDVQGFEELQSRFSSLSDSLRETSISSLLASDFLEEKELLSLAESLDAVVHFHFHANVGMEELDALFARPRLLAADIKARRVDVLITDESSVDAMRETIVASAARLQGQLRRLDPAGKTVPHVYSDVVSVANSEGYTLLQLSYYHDIDSISPGLAAELREVGASLYQVRVSKMMPLDESKVFNSLEACCKKLTDLHL